MCDQTIKGEILGAELAKPLNNVKVEALDEQKFCLKSTISAGEGNWAISPPENCAYIKFTHEFYVSKIVPVSKVSVKTRLLENKLIGYQDKLEFFPSERVAARVHCPGKYSACLFRHGFHKERILDFGVQSESIQQVPDGCFVDTGLDWNASLTYQIPADARPGLYSLLLTSENNAAFAIPMVVSTAKKDTSFK